MSTGRMLLRGAGVRVLANFAQMGVALCLTPHIFRTLGARHFGFWVLAASLLGFYGLLDLGISSGVARFSARALGKNDESEFRRYFSSSFWLLTGIGAGVFVLTFGIAFVAAAMTEGAGDARAVFWLVTIMGGALATLFPGRAFTGLLAAHLRYDLVSTMTMISSILRLPLILFAFHLGLGLVGLAACIALLQLLEAAGVAVCAFRVHSGLTLSRDHFRKDCAKELVGYGFHTLVAQLSDLMRHKLSPVIIAGFRGVTLLPAFDFADKLQRIVGELCKALMSVLTPVFSRQEGQGDQEAMRRAYLFTCKIAAFAAMLLGGLMIMFGGVFLERWIGPEFRWLEPVMQIFVLGQICAGAQMPTVQFLFGTSRHKHYAKTNVIHGLAVLGLTMLLIGPYGLIGVALGAAIPTVLIKFFVQPVYACRAIGIPLQEFYFKHAFRNLLVPVPFMALVWFGVRPFARPEYLSILSLAGTACLFYAPYIFLLGFSRDERNKLLAAVLPDRASKPKAPNEPPAEQHKKTGSDEKELVTTSAGDREGAED